MIFVTGDCHGEFSKLSYKSFPEQKEMTKDDFVIICGDFGAVWDYNGQNSSERYWLKWLNERNFITVFVDGNHENYDRLNNDYPIVDFHGGKAHKINDSVFHLLRGEIFDFQGLRFLAFGGAASHDISYGVLNKEDFKSEKHFKEKCRILRKRRQNFRINRVNWWEEELPSELEIQNCENNLAKCNYKVDYVIAHSAPQSIVSNIQRESSGPDEINKLTAYFDDLCCRLKFNNWFFGHYHDNRKFMSKYVLLYEQVIRIK
ncbi:MAG: metallophosphoesterase [Ruminococcus sp.]|nr:metallophosphoesterase [Ruminococcus sp.]